MFKVYQLWVEKKLYVKNTNYKDMVTKLVLNSVLHYVGLSWIIERKKQLEFDIHET